MLNVAWCVMCIALWLVFTVCGVLICLCFFFFFACCVIVRAGCLLVIDWRTLCVVVDVVCCALRVGCFALCVVGGLSSVLVVC